MFKKLTFSIFSICFLLILINNAFATYDIFLRAEVINKVLPDGTVVPMWGYARDSGVGIDDGNVSVPGPVITIPENETNVRIYLENNLPVPTSIIIPGQYQQSGGGPVRNSSGRIQSLSHETPPGSTVLYEWGDFKPGTYLLHSGTDIAVQVPMGLYCVIKKDTALNQVYGSNTAYSNEAVVVFSEIDTELNTQVHNNPGVGTISSINYEPKYYLVNGNPFYPGITPIDIGDIGSNKLIRIVNAGLKDRVFSMGENYFKVIAEDGNEYPFHQSNFAIIVAAGQTKDVLFTPNNYGYYPIFDRKLGLKNYLQTTGGILTYLRVKSPNEFTLNVNKTGTGAGKVIVASSPGGIDCGNDCTETYNENTVIRLKAIPDTNSKFVGWSGGCTGNGDCEITLASNTSVTANFAPLTNIIVNYPNGGEILKTGSNYLISWQAPSNATKFSIFYSLNNGSSWSLIAKNIPRRDFLWNVPAIKNNTNKAKIRVIGYNASNTQVGIDSSDLPFSIEVVRVTSPDASGLVFSSGTPWQITWDTYLTSQPVANTIVQYSINGGLTWNTLAILTGNPGSYSGSVPRVTSTTTKGLVRVLLRNAKNIVVGVDVSDNFFTINP